MFTSPRGGSVKYKNMSTSGAFIAEFLNCLSDFLWFLKENHVLGSYTFEYAIATDVWEKEKEEKVLLKLITLQVDLKSFLIRWRQVRIVTLKHQVSDVNAVELLPELDGKDVFFTRADESSVQNEVELLPELGKGNYFAPNDDNCVEERVKVLSELVQKSNGGCVGGNKEMLPQLLVKDSYFAVQDGEKSVGRVELLSELEKSHYFEIKRNEKTIVEGVGVLSELVEKSGYFTHKETENCSEKHVEMLPSFVAKTNYFGPTAEGKCVEPEVGLLPDLNKDAIYFPIKQSKGNVQLLSELVTGGSYFQNKESVERADETAELLPNLTDKVSFFTSRDNEKCDERNAHQQDVPATLKENKNNWFDFNDCSSPTFNPDEDKPQSVGSEPKVESNIVVQNLDTENQYPGIKTAVQTECGGSEKKSYVCLTCDKSFKSKFTRDRHSRTHTGEKIFPCNCCNKTFASRTSLESHLVRQHNTNLDSAVPCPDCGKLFVKKNALEVHLLKHKSEKQFLCEICGKTFTQKVSRDIHLIRHSGKYEYKCELCNKEFPYRSLLNAHMYKHQTPRFSCNVCGKQFVRNDILKTHMATHGDHQPHQCSQCPKAFYTKSNLVQHEKLHSGVPFQCHVCCAEFKYKSGLAAHVKKHSVVGEVGSSPRRKKKPPGQAPGEKHLCSVCGQEFQKSDSLKKHEKSHHRQSGLEQSRPHCCHVCSKRFTQKSSLNQHLKTHVQDPLYSCEMCGRCFHRKDVYDRHMTTHSGQRPYSCAHCGKAFTFKSNLSAHLATHPGFSQRQELCCNDCGKLFKHKSSFNLHRKSHLGQFTHTCETCGKKFMKRSHYESHVRSHQTDRPFICSTCGKGYKERKHYRQHAKKMHPNEFNLEALIASITCEDEILCPEPVASDALFGSTQSVLGPDAQMMDKPGPSPNVGMFSPPSSFPNLDPLLQDINTVNFIATSLDEQHQSLVNSIQTPLAVLSGEDTTSVLSQRLKP